MFDSVIPKDIRRLKITTEKNKTMFVTSLLIIRFNWKQNSYLKLGT